ncbi:HNH endonuclease signature motif containing protein [Enterobacter asburiae]
MKEITDYLEISKSSPSGLVWKKSPGAKVKIGDAAFTTVTRSGYYSGKLQGERLSAHVVVFILHNGFLPKGEVDHIDGDRTNNDPKNLRDVSRSVNAQNRKKAKGYSFHKRINKYIATINEPGTGRRLHLGYFECEIDARNAYLTAKKSLHVGYVGDRA